MSLLENLKKDIDKGEINTSMVELVNKQESTTSQMFGRALKDDSLIGIAVDESIQAYDDYKVEEDKSFSDAKKDVLIEQYGESIHEDFRDDLRDRAKSLPHFKQLLSEYQHQTHIEEGLDNSGMLGFGLRFASEVTNIPAYIAPQFVLPKVALALNTGILGRAGYGAVEGAVFEYAKGALGDTEKSNLELGLGAGIGAVVGAKWGNLSDGVLEIARNDIKAKMKITNEFEQKLISANTKEAKDELLEAHFKKHNIGKQSDYEEELFNLQKRAEDGTFNKGVASKLRLDLKHLTSKSPSDIISEFSRQNFKDSTLQGNATGMRTMNEEALAIEDRLIEESQTLFNPLVKDFADKVYGKNWVTSRWSDARVVVSNIAGNMQMHRNLYGDTVTDEDTLSIGVEMLKSYGADEEYATELAKKLIKASSDNAIKSHGILKQYGKSGFEEGGIEQNAKYMPIVYNRNMDKVIDSKHLKKNDLKSFVNGSLVSMADKRLLEATGTKDKTLSQADLDSLREISDLLTEAIYKSDTATSMSGNSFDDIIRGVLASNKDKLIGTNPELANFLFKESAESFKKTGTSSRFRSPFDYSHRQKFINSKGEEVELSFMDLVNKNILGNHTQYSRKMGGAVALEKTKFVFPKKVFDFESTKKITDTINSALRDFGNTANNIMKSEKSKKEIESIIQDEKKMVLEFIRKNIPDDFKNNMEDIIKAIESKSSFFTNLARDAHKLKLTEDGFEDVYNQLLKDNKVEIDRLNNIVNELFTKNEDEVLTLGTEAERIRVKSKIAKELSEKGINQRDAQSEMTRFNEIIDDYLGKPTSVDPFGALTQGQRISSNLNIARLLGQTGITMSAEMGGLVFRTGIRNFMEFSSFKSLIKQMKTGNIDDKFAQEIQTHIGLGTALTRDINPNAYDHEFDLQGLSQVGIRDGILDKMENISAKFADATLMVGGVKPLTANGEIIISKTVINEIAQIAGKGKGKLSKLDIKNLNEYGFDENMAKRIHSQIKEFGKFEKKKWSNGHKVQELGYENWTDSEAQKFLTNSVRRISNNIIQKSMLGDKVGNVVGEKLFKNTLFGKMFLELKDYMVTSYVAQLGRMLTRKDAHMMGMFMAQASALTVASVGQNYMNNATNKEKLEESLKPENIVRRVVSLMPSSSYIPTAIDTVSNTFAGERIFSPSRHQSEAQNVLMSLPIIDLFAKIQGTMTETGKSLYNMETTDGLIRNVFGIAPLGNTYGVRTAKESLLENK